MVIWRPIIGYENDYEISNCGTVKSIKGRFNGKVLSYQENSSGYFRVRLCLRGKIKFHFVHRLVADAFIKKSKGRDVVNHINGNKKDNTVENLEWVTRSENNSHSYRKLNRKGAWKGKTGYLHHMSKEVIAINALTGEEIVFGSRRQAAEKLGLSDSNICKAINNKNKQLKGWLFK